MQGFIPILQTKLNCIPGLNPVEQQPAQVASGGTKNVRKTFARTFSFGIRGRELESIKVIAALARNAGSSQNRSHILLTPRSPHVVIRVLVAAKQEWP